MKSINEKLAYIEAIKELIKKAIRSKGVDVSDSDTFRSYVDKIGEISTGGGSQPVVMPDYLTEVEYIQKTSGSHNSAIQLPIAFGKTIKLETKFRLMGYSTTSTSYPKYIFGVYASANNANVSALYVSTSATTIVWSWGEYGVNRRYSQLATANTTTDYTVEFSDDKVISNDEEKTILYTHSSEELANDWQADRVLSLFGVPYKDLNHIAYSRIYYMKIYDGETLKYDLIPVLNNKTLTYGLFDKVTGGYFDNSEYATLYTGGNPV